MFKKVIVVGDAGVGKDTLIHKIKSDIFLSTYKSTVGVEVFPLDIEGKKITIWNCALIYVFDKTNLNSLSKVIELKKDVIILS